MRLPVTGVGEEVGDFGSDARRGKEIVGGGNGVGGAFDLHRGLDGAQDGVDGSVEAEGFFDDLGIEGESLQVVVGEGR